VKQEKTRIIAHRRQQADYLLLKLSAPLIGPRVRPGQFIGLQVPRLQDAVLRRPFSVYRADSESISLLYKVVGRGTAAISRLAAGEEVDVIGPLGNGFPEGRPGALPVLVGGGYGAAALRMQAEALPRKGVVFFGGRSLDDILCVEEFRELGWEVQVATEDGSLGKRGLVTDIFDRWCAGAGTLPIELFACGPQGMLRALAGRAQSSGFTAWLSLDRHMACGVGVCLTCVVRKTDPAQQWRWVRCCKEGPVFNAGEIAWDD